MQRAQDGDRAAYRLLLHEIAPYLRSIASRYHRETSDVEDAVQDILLAIHTARRTYDPSRPITPWLRGVARHRMMDRLRQQDRISRKEARLEAEHETFPDPRSNTQDAALTARDIKSAIAQLPKGQRQAIELLKLQELSLMEASVVSGKTTGSLKVASHRALRSLRKLLRD